MSGMRAHGRAKTRVFISYRRLDGSGYARLLYESLQHRLGRKTVFIDVDAIDLGTDFVEAIDTALDTTDVAVAMIGQRWLTACTPAGRRLDDPNDYVRMELAGALERDIPVIPVLVENALMPSAGDLPPALAPLATRNAIALSDSGWRGDVERLAQTIESFVPTRLHVRTRRRLAAGAVLVAAFLTAGAVVGRDRPAVEALTEPSFPQSSSLDHIQRIKNVLDVGVTFSQVGLANREHGYEHNASGFEPDLAVLLAAAIFGDKPADIRTKGRIRFHEVVAKNRAAAIQNRDVDIVIAQYSITEERKKDVSFAGPYLITHQELMVKSDNHDINGLDDLRHRKLCAVNRTTSMAYIEAKEPEVKIEPVDRLYDCDKLLTTGQVDGVTGDDIGLANMVAQRPKQFRRLGAHLQDERYGIGFRKGDWHMCHFIRGRLHQIFRTKEWHDAFVRNLGVRLASETPEPPNLDPCPPVPVPPKGYKGGKPSPVT